MELLQPHGGLQSVVSGIRPAGKNIHGRILRKRRTVDSKIAALIRVVEPRQFRALAADVTKFHRQRMADLLLNVQAPALHAWRAQIVVRTKNGLCRTCRSCSKYRV